MTDAEPKFLHALVLDGRGGARALDNAGVNDWRPEDGTLWVHIDVNDPPSRTWLAEHGDLPQVVTEALLAGESRPWTSVSEDSLMANLRGVNTNPDSNPEDMVSVRIYIEANRIFSSRRRKLLSVVDIVTSLEEGSGPANASQCFSRITERLSDRIGEFIDRLEGGVDGFEDSFDETDSSALRRALAEMRRQIASVRRFLAPQRDALDRMNRRRPDVLSEEDAIDLLQEADRITRYLEDLDLARERVVVLQEELVSRIAQEQNSRMYVLSVVAAVFLPLTFITGLLGMNVGGLPGLENPAGFAASIVIMLVAAALLIVYFRWKKWF